MATSQSASACVVYIEKTVSEHIRDRLMISGLARIIREQGCPRFIRLMENRRIVGYFRYPPIRQNGAPKYDNIGEAIRHLRDYLATGNQEHLVDAANLCLIEFVRGCCHPRPFFRTIDDGHHAEVIE